jgi:uncharacterized protein (TIGR03000 family)
VLRLPWLVASLLIVSSSLPAQESSPILIYVTLPADAKLAVDGVPVKQMGAERRLITPPFKFGEIGKYTLTATFTKDGKEVTVTRQITVEGGKLTRVDLTKDEGKVAEPKKIDLGPSPMVDPPKKEEPKKEEPKKEEPKKEEPKKEEPKKEEPKKEIKVDVPFIATPSKVVSEMLKLAGVKEGDVVYDLGSGDGRIVISAVKDFKAKKGVGIELAPERVKLAKENAQKAGVADKIEIREADVLKLMDVSEANVVTLYLLPDVNEKLRPMLRKTLKAGSRIVSHDFDLGPDFKPEKEITVKDEENREHTIYLWTIKERPAKLDNKPPPPPEKKKKDEAKPPVLPPAKKADEPKAVKKDEPTIKVPYVPTPLPVVEAMLKLGGVKEGDVVYDLGCGDGRIVVSAVKDFKAKKGVGVDIDPDRIKESKQNAKDNKVEDKVEFKQGDVLKIEDVSEATVICLYLFPEVNERLQPMLRKTLKPGSRIVSHDFLMRDDWKPEKEVNVKDSEGQEHTLYLWTIKEK